MFTMYVIPLARPEIAEAANGPAIAHSSGFSLVSASNPPTRARSYRSLPADSDRRVQESTLASQSPPIPQPWGTRRFEWKGCRRNWRSRFPGAVDGYQVNFRLPSDTGEGTAAIQVTAAWIAGARGTIPVE